MHRSPHQPPRRSRTARHHLAGACLLAVAALLAACGGSSSTDPPASRSAALQEDALKFSKCMREHGIKNFPNPEFSEGHTQLHVKAGGPGGIEVAPQTMEAAQKACQHYQEALAPKLTPQERVQHEEALQKFAACMRKNGVHVEVQSAPGGGGVGIRVGQRSGGGGGANPESPSFQKAQEECQKLLPNKPGGFRGPGPLARSKRPPSGGGRKTGSSKESSLSVSGG